MAYEIYLPASIYSIIEEAKPVNTVNTLDIVNNCVNVGNWYIPIANILAIKEV